MKTLMIAVLAAGAFSAVADTAYPIAKETAKANRQAVEKFKDGAFWQKSPFAVAAVDPMSGWRYLPDALPREADYQGGVKVMLAQGEYEDGSVCLFGFEDLKDVEIVPSDLACKDGKLSAAEIDVKVVKTWYQQGTAWYGGFQSDVTRRVLTPELLLHDETLVHVDYANKENYLRCNYGGETKYRWISTTGPSVDHSGVAEPDYSYIHDAEAPKPFALQKDCFKQVVFTFHAPKDLPGGLYKGAFAMKVGGKTVGSLPVTLRVLPFSLPKPMTFRDLNRRFRPSGYMYQNIIEYPKLAANLAAHGIDTAFMFKRTGVNSAKGAKRAYEILKRYDLNTETLMCVLPSASVTTSFPVQESNKRYQEYLDRVAEAESCMKAIREGFGPNAHPYAYAIDEAPPETVRAERAIWQAYQKMGARIIASTGYHPYLLFNLDAANIPRQPRNQSRLNADSMHAANPDFMASWYGDPHSGPENPDYCRRIYGWLTWRNNYDMFSQYIIERDDWTEFYVWKEAFLRGLMIVYPQDDGYIDTLAWEATREAVDDIRYGTYLKQLAEKARQSADVDTQYLGRAAATWIGQVDYERSSLDALRQEMVERILALREKVISVK